MDKNKSISSYKNLLTVLLLLFVISASFFMSSASSLSKYVFDLFYTVGISSSATFSIASIGAIGGSAQVDQTLTAGSVSPTGATADYQWQSCSTVDGTYTNISGATSSTYVLTADEQGKYIKVIASGNGSYTGVVKSASIGPVGTAALINITAIGAISGTAQTGQTLSVGELTPSGATATYQWTECSTANGTYTNILNATSGTYALVSADYGKYIKVTATGSGSYTGTVTSAAAVGPITSGVLTGITNIIGNTNIGSVLTAGTVTPLGATVSYQWISIDSNGTSTDISGATASTFTLTSTQSYCYIRVRATGTGSYSGSVTSASTISRVGAATTAITAIGGTSGTTQVGQTLTAGDLAPTYAVATYQWSKCSTSNGSFTSISGATSTTYTLTSADYGNYFKVTAIGSGSYTGTVSNSAVGPVTYGIITNLAAISGTAASGQTLTAGTVTPSGATVAYQWQRSSTAYGTYSDISGATSSTYSLGTSNAGYYFRVTVTGTGNYSGTLTSNIIGPVISGNATAITAIGNIVGTLTVGQTIYAGDITPTGSTVTYQWMRSSTLGGTYSNITGTSSSSYTLTSDDYNCYIKVKATGSGSYTGTVTSASAGPITAYPLTGISDIIGNTCVGKALTAGTVTPLGATVTYQWQRSTDGSGSSFVDIGAATSSSYTMMGEDSYRYIRLKVVGSGSYTGTIYSNMTAGRVGSDATPLTAIDSITGNAQVGKTLTVGALTPLGSTATYQWVRCQTSNGSYSTIQGATSSTYTLTMDDYGYYIEVVATGSGYFSGAITSSARGPVTVTTITAISNIGGTAAAGQSLTAGTVTPSGATVTYQWQTSASSNGTYTDVSGATNSTYYLGSGDVGNYLKVKVTGTGGYTGSVTSACVGPVFSGTATPITAIGAISGTAKVGNTLTAGSLTPSGATVTYQWQRCSTSGGTYTNISGATSNTYKLTASDYTCFIKVKATGSGSYSGTAMSDATVSVVACQITAISNVIGSTYSGMTLTAGTVTPIGATVTYQWQLGDWDYNYTGNIAGATSNSFTLDTSFNGRSIRLMVTGTGAYSGTIYSAWVPNQIGQNQITSLQTLGNISGTAKVGSTLTVGTIGPSGAVATYQWMRCSTSTGDYENIAGATSSTYVPVSGDIGYYIKVVVTGSGKYTGILTSAAVGSVTS